MAGMFDKYEKNRNTEQKATEQAVTNQKSDVEDTTTVKVMFSMTNAQKIKLKQKALEQGKTASALVQEFIDSLK